VISYRITTSHIQCHAKFINIHSRKEGMFFKAYRIQQWAEQLVGRGSTFGKPEGKRQLGGTRHR
jgi:hypothetical protein